MEHGDLHTIHRPRYRPERTRDLENEGVLFDRVRWGRIREHISYEDTQRTREFDRKLGVAAGA